MIFYYDFEFQYVGYLLSLQSKLVFPVVIVVYWLSFREFIDRGRGPDIGDRAGDRFKGIS